MVNLEIVQMSAVTNSGPEMMKEEDNIKDNFDGEDSIASFKDFFSIFTAFLFI